MMGGTSRCLVEVIQAVAALLRSSFWRSWASCLMVKVSMVMPSVFIRSRGSIVGFSTMLGWPVTYAPVFPLASLALGDAR